MAAAVGGVALSADESVGFEWVEQRDEHARGHVHGLDEVALGQSAVVVQQSQDLELPRLEVVRGVGGAQAVHRLLPEQRQQQAGTRAVLVKDARRGGGCGVGGCGHREVLDLGATPAVELTIQAASLDTKLAKRDEHLRSKDFFDAERHPQVRFTSDSAEFDGDTLRVRGQLHAAGRQIPLAFDAKVREIGRDLEIEAVTEADHRELGMTWSPLGILRAPSKLIVRGRLVRR
jgi:YceI-like domain